jgi:hypothetical protein
MAQLKIEAKEKYLEYGAEQSTKLDPVNVEIEIFNGEELVVKTTLESLVLKFLSISTEYMQAQAIISKINEKLDESGFAEPDKSKIVLPGGN